jgi:hypothetical protein
MANIRMWETTGEENSFVQIIDVLFCAVLGFQAQIFDDVHRLIEERIECIDRRSVDATCSHIYDAMRLTHLERLTYHEREKHTGDLVRWCTREEYWRLNSYRPRVHHDWVVVRPSIAWNEMPCDAVVPHSRQEWSQSSLLTTSSNWVDKLHDTHSFENLQRKQMTFSVDQIILT